MYNSDTIIAIATPPGKGGVGILRISGSNALNIAKKITKKNSFVVREASFSSFYDTNEQVLDEGLTIYFKAPHSFTGEEVVEFQTHGSPVVLDLLLKTCLHFGARLAKPGEFSERAFLNDKMDLAQAEAVADLINASSETAARMAVRSLQGDFSQTINALNEQIIQLRLYVEAAIDFPDEDIDFLADGKVQAWLLKIIEQLNQIRRNATQGAVLREGLNIVIAGKPNAGKSTLINQLSGQPVAIVTEIAGTTRDVMRQHVLLDDIPVHLIDTAGLRESDDVVEKEGIKRAWDEVEKADCVLLVMDASLLRDTDLDEAIRKRLPNQVPIIRVINKIDTVDVVPNHDPLTVAISAKLGTGLAALKSKIKTLVGFQLSEGSFLARRRHLQALEQAGLYLESGRIQLEHHLAGELLAEDLRLAHLALCEITGEFSSDDLLGRIFSSFCIGK